MKISSVFPWISISNVRKANFLVFLSTTDIPDFRLEFDELAKKSKRSRNELMCMALEYALENLKFTTKLENNNEYENSDKEA